MYKIIKNGGTSEKKRFMPHLFKKIDVCNSLICQEETEKRKVFEPVIPKENACFSPDSTREPVENEDPFEDLAENAYNEGFKKGEKAGFKEGEKAGFKEGEKTGTEFGIQKLQTIYDSFDEAIAELGKIKEDLRLSAENGAVELALAIAEKIVFHEVSVNKETLLGVLEKALGRVVDQEKIKIRIHKSDLQILNESECDIAGLTTKTKNLSIEGDDTISRGGCVIETGFGSIDARIESQLQAVGDLLRSEMP